MTTPPSLLPSAGIAERVRDRLRREGIDPHRRAEDARRIAWDEVRTHNDVALARGIVPIDDEAGCVRDALASVAGFGPLQEYLDDPTKPQT